MPLGFAFRWVGFSWVGTWVGIVRGGLALEFDGRPLLSVAEMNGGQQIAIGIFAVMARGDTAHMFVDAPRRAQDAANYRARRFLGAKVSEDVFQL